MTNRPADHVHPLGFIEDRLMSDDLAEYMLGSCLFYALFVGGAFFILSIGLCLVSALGI